MKTASAAKMAAGSLLSATAPSFILCRCLRGGLKRQPPRPKSDPARHGSQSPATLGCHSFTVPIDLGEKIGIIERPLKKRRPINTGCECLFRKGGVRWKTRRRKAVVYGPIVFML